MTKTTPVLDYDEIHALAVQSRQLRAFYIARLIVRLIGLVTRRRTADPVPAPGEHAVTA